MKFLRFLLMSVLGLLLLLHVRMLPAGATADSNSNSTPGECPANDTTTGTRTDSETCTSTTEPQPAPTTTVELPVHVPVAYVRDNPLHANLVQDTLRALQRSSNKKKKKTHTRYFEGWYYKIDLPGHGGSFVMIPGLYLHAEDPHGFVMMLDASAKEDQAQQPECFFYRMETPVERILEHSRPDGDHDFVFWLDPHIIFTAHGYTVNLPATTTNPAVQAKASWTQLPLSHTTRWNPTIMGWFAWLPRGWAQCHHGVVSMDHTLLDGSRAVVGNKVIPLEGAKGYIEKDWGREFPEWYTWMQANDFVDNTQQPQQEEIAGASFLLTVSSMPVKPFEKWWVFQGFLSFLRYPDANGIFQVIRLCFYNGAKANYTYKVTAPTDGPRQHRVVVTLTSSKHTLVANVTGDRDHAATLWGPLPTNPSGGMKPYVREMLNCPVHVVLRDRKTNQVLFDGTAQHGGFEIQGRDK